MLGICIGRARISTRPHGKPDRVAFKEVVLARVSFLVICLLVLASSAQATSKLKATMKGWKADLQTADSLLGGGKTEDAAWQRIFASLSADSRDFSSALGSSTAARRDLSARFARLSAEADSLAAGGTDAKKRFAALRGECTSCHDIYAK